MLYEQFRNDFQSRICDIFGKDITLQILNQLDFVATNYDIQKKETSLVVIDDRMSRLIKDYIVSKRLEGLSELTLENYFAHLKDFRNNVLKNPEEVTANDIRRYLYEYKRIRGCTDRSLDKLRQHINGFFEWLATERYIDENVCKKIKSIKYEEPQRKAMSQEELEYIREACITPRDKAMVEFLYSTGCRASELCNCKISDVNFEAGTVALFGKGKKHRTSYLNAKCKVTLQNYLNSRDDENVYLFVGVRKPHNNMTRHAVEGAIASIVSRARNVDEKYTPHSFRHTTATVALENGMDFEKIRKLLGHENISTTMIYAQCTDKDVADAHKKYII